MTQSPELSLVFPAFNEADNLPLLLESGEIAYFQSQCPSNTANPA